MSTWLFLTINLHKFNSNNSKQLSNQVITSISRRLTLNKRSFSRKESLISLDHKAEGTVAMDPSQQIVKLVKLDSLMSREKNHWEERKKLCKLLETLKTIPSN